jgi:hypothetical protein
VELHVEEHVLMRLEHLNGICVGIEGEDDEGATADDSLILLCLSLFVAFGLFVEEVPELFEKIRAVLCDFPQKPVPVLLRSDQGSKFFHFWVLAVDDEDVHIVLVELVDGADAR